MFVCHTPRIRRNSLGNWYVIARYWGEDENVRVSPPLTRTLGYMGGGMFELFSVFSAFCYYP